MPDDDEVVKSKGHCECQLVVDGGKQCGEPARLSAVHDQEEDVALPNAFLQFANLITDLLFFCFL